jgi:AcrR family transcriptional regulator
MPRGFTEEERAAIMERLVEAGHDLFSRFGLKKTNVSELAEAARISKGAFYRFYPSKESLFMDVIEKAEGRYREELLSVIQIPGAKPRSRLLGVLQKAFTLLEELPLLQFMTSSDYGQLFQSVPTEKVKEHLRSDRLFFETFIANCRAAGIPIEVDADEISNLLYPIVLAVLHKDELGMEAYGGSIDVLLELVAAFCLGEVELDRERASRP